ncbi:MAG: HD domain-containing protein [Catenulispora sp.]|nr:HD domain-containing protein [Catenulispora sp.]
MPEAAAELLRDVGAPLRLVAHLRLVHDVAAQLVGWVEERGLDVGIDPAAVCFGAATHDIGKALHPAELSGPGARHEEAGRDLLVDHGVAPSLARFAATHATWNPGTGTEDLLVSLADKVWKGKRVPELEDLVVGRLAAVSGLPGWEEFLKLDEVLAAIGDLADDRLSYQMSFPVSR